jgi:hypothetical protein
MGKNAFSYAIKKATAKTATACCRRFKSFRVLRVLGGYNAIKINLLRPLRSPFTGGKVPVYRRKGPRLQEKWGFSMGIEK